MRPEWVNQLWFQVYSIYQDNPNGFRLTDAEIQQLQEDNHDFEVPLPYELEILNLLDMSLPVKMWQWWKDAEVSNLLYGNAAATSVGKALTKIVSLPRFTKLTTLITKKNPKPINGIQQYLIPLKHFTSN